MPFDSLKVKQSRKRFGVLVPIMGALVLAVGLLIFGPLPSAKADSCGYVNVSGANWFSGSGVDSHSNYPDEGTPTDCGASGVHNLNPTPPAVPQYGDAWQCVELPQRLYNTRGWFSGVFVNVDHASQIFSNASQSGFTTQAQGAIILANVVPGDMLVTTEYGGHVMLVDSVNTSNNTISAVDQNGADGGRTTVTYNPTTKNLSDGTYYVFTNGGVVHSPNNKGSGTSPTPSTPTALSRASTNMAVFYNDQKGDLVNWSWDSVNGWSSYSWADSGGINGQIAAVTRTSDSMDVFYRTGQNKLVYKAWTASGGWVNPYPIVSSGVVGDPAVAVRDSNHMQVFYRDSSGNMDSIGWSNGTWDASPQTNYLTGAVGDPAAISRTSDSMDVFFVKNNENLVHLGWTAAYGWNSSDWTTYMTGKPTAIKWNSGNDMAAFYEQINGNVGEESWDSSTGWAAQTWAAALSGNPSAVAGVNNTIDNFYREIDGKVSDRYLTGSSWNTTVIAGSNTATSTPNAITRGTTSEEVFYWNGTSLMDNNWNTTSQSWNGGVKINN